MRWVLLQMSGIVLNLIPLFWQRSLTLPAGLFLTAAGILGLWTLWHNRPGNFRIHPDLHPHTRLVTTGPYHWMRHPMYASLLLTLAGTTVVTVHPLSGLGWILVAVAVAQKARIEERLLRARFPEYAPYATRTARIVPGFY